MIGTVAPPPGLLGRLLGALGYVKAAPPQPGALYPPPAQMSSYPLTFPGWAELEAMQPGNGQDDANVRTALSSSWVYACVDAIAKEMSVAELEVKARRGLGEGDQDVENHPLEVLWESPNPFMGRSFLVTYWAMQRLLYGKAYLYWLPGDNGEVAECWPIPTSLIMPIPDPKKFIGGYLFRAKPTDKPTRIDAKFVTYSRLPHPLDIRDGLSPLASALVDVEAELAMSKWNRAFFASENATPEGLISLPKDMLDQDLVRVRQEIRDFFGGGRRRVAIARSGDMDWKPFGRSQKEMEFLQGRTFSGEAIMRAYGIPAGYFAKDATRANSEGAKATMIENAVWPHLVALAEDLNAQMIPHWYGPDYRASFSDIRPRNIAMELQQFTTYAAVLTVDELRQRIDMEPIGDERGALLVAEVGKGGPPPEPPTGADGMPPPAELDDIPEPASGPTPSEADAQPDAAPPEVDEAKALDLQRWQVKALKALRAGRAADVPFRPDVTPPEEAEHIAAGLKAATTPDEVRAVFAPFGPAASATKAASPRERSLTRELASSLASAQPRAARAAMAGDPKAGTTGIAPTLTSALAQTYVDDLLAYAAEAGLPIDPALAAAQGAEWAGRYAPGAIAGMDATTQRVVERVIGVLRATPGMTLAQAAALLSPAFGAARAEVIAATELTRASAQAAVAAQDYLQRNGIVRALVWRTNNDERVCAVCGPRDGARQGEGWDEPPPAHPRCRCAVTLAR